MKEADRAQVAGFLDVQGPRDWSFFVRVNPFDNGMPFDDLIAVVKPGLEGMLTQTETSDEDLGRIVEELDRLEAQCGEIGQVSVADSGCQYWVIWEVEE